MRRARMSLRISMSSAMVAACASVSLIVGAACGGGAASPTPTTASTVPSPAGVAPSPQRPALSSPVASPSALAISTPTAGSDASSTASGDTYEIQSGDTLLTVAEQSYGDATQWRKIYDANKDVIGPDPDKLKVGMKLKIPPKQ